MIRGGCGAVQRMACVVVAMLAAVGPAYAQGRGGDPAAPQTGDDRQPSNRRTHRFLVHVHGAYQPTVRRYDRARSFQAYGEQAQFVSREEFRGRDHVDAGAAVRVWRGLEFGASYTQVSRSGTVEVRGTVPHPLDVGRERTAPARTLVLPHRQRATHVYAAWRVQVREGWSLSLSAGPTYFNLRQGVVANVTPSEAGGPPFADVNVHIDAGEHTRNGVGFNTGADFMIALTPANRQPRLGVGYFVRLAVGAVDVPSPADDSHTYYVGGVQTGVGLRLQF